MNFRFGRLGAENADRTDEAQDDLSTHPNGSKQSDLSFRPKESVVYPAHGVGQILAIEVQAFAGASLEFFLIYFAKSKMKLRVPTQKAATIGLRKLSSPAVIKQVRRTLSEVSPRKRTNWARLIKEVEPKIKSGDIIALSEVMRDLYPPANSEQSYSERQFYTAAQDRVSGEVALVEGITEEKAASELESLLFNRSRKARTILN
jgi:CarD family transcriptional regulator